MRLAVFASGVSQAPYARPIARDVSQRRGKGYSNFRANAAFSETGSKETPRISALRF